jgi:tRNA (cmo5U34)-methyltransferase
MKELLELAGFKDICKFYQSYLFGGYIAEMA